jgi:hypothetical protein
VQQIVALADEEVRRVMRAVSADVQASLALSRATLQALAALSPTLNAAAEHALEQELVLAQRLAAPQRVIDVIEDAKLRLAEAPEEERMASALEQALIAAADALPETETATQQAC